MAELRELIPIGQRRVEIEKEGEICFPVGEYIRDPNTSILRMESYSALSGSSWMLWTISQGGWRLTMELNLRFRRHSLVALCYITLTRTLGLVQIPVSMLNFIASPEFLESNISRASFDQGKLLFHLASSQHQFVLDEIASLRACAMMAEIYKLLPDATISTLAQAKWVPRPTQNIDGTLRLSQAFAYVAIFESGTFNLDPSTLSEVFAISFGNSLYVAASLLCHPYE